MRDERKLLHEKLETIGIPVYFQPPASTRMKFPCIIYNYDSVNSIEADNINYINRIRIKMTVIDVNPDSKYPFDVLELIGGSEIENIFVTDALYHSVLRAYI